MLNSGGMMDLNWYLGLVLDLRQRIFTGKLLLYAQREALAVAFQQHFLSSDYLNMAANAAFEQVDTWLREVLNAE